MRRSPTLPVSVPSTSDERRLTAEAFQVLAAVPPELEWFRNLGNASTQRTYRAALTDFMTFVGIQQPEDFRKTTRAHVIAWRDELAGRGLSATTIRNRLSAIGSLFNYLCERNAIGSNPVDGVKRPPNDSREGKTPVISDEQARRLLAAPEANTLKGKRDRALLAVFLYHAPRREEVSKLKVRDARQERRGVSHLRIHGKGGKLRYVPLHPAVSSLIADYLEASGHGDQPERPLFLPLHHACEADSADAMTPDGIYKLVCDYSAALGFRRGAHALRATAATNALENGADLKEVRDWLGHTSVSTTTLYDRRRTRPEDSPTFAIRY